MTETMRETRRTMPMATGHRQTDMTAAAAVAVGTAMGRRVLLPLRPVRRQRSFDSGRTALLP